MLTLISATSNTSECQKSGSARHLETEAITDDDDVIANSVEHGLGVRTHRLGGIDHRWIRPTSADRSVRGHSSTTSFRATSEAEKQLRRDALKAVGAWRDAGCPQRFPRARTWSGRPWTGSPASRFPMTTRPCTWRRWTSGREPASIPRKESARSHDSRCSSSVAAKPACWPASDSRKPGYRSRSSTRTTDVGGTWLENTYPGCRWTSPATTTATLRAQRLLQRLLRSSARVLRLLPRRCSTSTVSPTRPLAERGGTGGVGRDVGAWTVTARGRTARGVRTANALISGVGILNRPLIPDIPGMDQFDGRCFTRRDGTTRWT